MYYFVYCVLAVGVAPTLTVYYQSSINLLRIPIMISWTTPIGRPTIESNPDLEGQSLLCYHYTIGQWLVGESNPSASCIIVPAVPKPPNYKKLFFKFLPRVTLPALDKALCNRIPTNFNFLIYGNSRGSHVHWDLSLPRIGCIGILSLSSKPVPESTEDIRLLYSNITLSVQNNLLIALNVYLLVRQL